MKRFLTLLADFARRYPELWKNIDRIRASRGEGNITDWPDWCFIPDHLTKDFIVATKKAGNMNIHRDDTALLPALAAWRPSQAVFHFSDQLFDSLINENVDEMSCLPLFHLPIWCCYIETPDADWIGEKMDGFFLYLTSVENKPELRIVPCTFSKRPVVSLPLPIGDWSILHAMEESLENTMLRKKQNTIDVDKVENSAKWREYRVMLSRMLSLALFLCSEKANIRDATGKATFKGNPVPKRTKQGLRMFPADNPKLWIVEEK